MLKYGKYKFLTFGNISSQSKYGKIYNTPQ